jgi:hypothetical protein
VSFSTGAEESEYRTSAVLPLAEPPALQDVCGREMPMADNSLQNSQNSEERCRIKDAVGPRSIN